MVLFSSAAALLKEIKELEARGVPVRDRLQDIVCLPP